MGTPRTRENLQTRADARYQKPTPESVRWLTYDRHFESDSDLIASMENVLEGARSYDGNALLFDWPKGYLVGFGTSVTGNISLDATAPKLGARLLLRHGDSQPFDVPSNATYSGQSLEGDYRDGELNYFEFVCISVSPFKVLFRHINPVGNAAQPGVSPAIVPSSSIATELQEDGSVKLRTTQEAISLQDSIDIRSFEIESIPDFNHFTLVVDASEADQYVYLPPVPFKLQLGIYVRTATNGEGLRLRLDLPAEYLLPGGWGTLVEEDDYVDLILPAGTYVQVQGLDQVNRYLVQYWGDRQLNLGDLIDVDATGDEGDILVRTNSGYKFVTPTSIEMSAALSSAVENASYTNHTTTIQLLSLPQETEVAVGMIHEADGRKYVITSVNVDVNDKTAKVWRSLAIGDVSGTGDGGSGGNVIPFTAAEISVLENEASWLDDNSEAPGQLTGAAKSLLPDWKIGDFATAGGKFMFAISDTDLIRLPALAGIGVDLQFSILAMSDLEWYLNFSQRTGWKLSGTSILSMLDQANQYQLVAQSHHASLVGVGGANAGFGSAHPSYVEVLGQFNRHIFQLPTFDPNANPGTETDKPIPDLAGDFTLFLKLDHGSLSNAVSLIGGASGLLILLTTDGVETRINNGSAQTISFPSAPSEINRTILIIRRSSNVISVDQAQDSAGNGIFVWESGTSTRTAAEAIDVYELRGNTGAKMYAIGAISRNVVGEEFENLKQELEST